MERMVNKVIDRDHNVGTEAVACSTNSEDRYDELQAT